MQHHWHTSELAAAVKYRVLEGGTADGYTNRLVARVGVFSEYVAPLVDRAFALHPAMYTVLTSEDDGDPKELPDLIVRGALLVLSIECAFASSVPLLLTFFVAVVGGGNGRCCCCAVHVVGRV